MVCIVYIFVWMMGILKGFEEVYGMLSAPCELSDFILLTPHYVCMGDGNLKGLKSFGKDYMCSGSTLVS